MRVPTLHNLKDFKCVGEKIQLLESWSIPVSKSDDVIWNVVLAYLNSFSASDEDELTRRIQCLTGHQEVKESIKRSVQSFNPFLHRDAGFFSDKEMSTIVAEFEKRVLNYTENDSVRSGEKYKYMEACSRLLSRNIKYISFDDKTAVIFPQAEPGLIYPEHISIFHFESSIVNSKRFAFGMPKDIGLERRRQAFQEILEGTRMFENKERIMQHIDSLSNNTHHFLIELEKHDLRQFMSLIFKSPYLLSKLADAGFETDPRTKDSEGKCAFFHALKTEQVELVSLLYDHAANIRLQTKATVFSPDIEIIENLQDLKIHLQLLEERIMVEEVGDKSKCLYLDLCRFNEFQIDICGSIYNIRAMTKDETENKYKAVLLILEKYLVYFQFKTVESPTDNDTFRLFQEFLEHKFYFDKVDFYSTVMLFDNLFLLKEKLKLKNDAYLDLESNFCLFFFLKKFLEKYQNQENFDSVCQWILFQERLSLQRQILNFKDVLEKTELSGDNIVAKIPEETVPTLTNLPEIYGKFLVSRLKHYLKAATELEVKDIKSILVIERCLQVLGESCKKCEFKSVQSILALALPKDFVKHANDIRDCLSHIESHELFYRTNFEGDTDLFIKIRNELFQVINYLLPIYSVQKYELDKFLLSHFLESSKKLQRRNCEVNENHLKTNFSPPEMKECRCPKTLQACSDDIQSFLKKIDIDLNFNGDILPNNRYKRAVENFVLAIREELKTVKYPVPEKAITELDRHFWCLETVLNYMLTDRKITEEDRSSFISKMGNRDIIFNELLKNAHQSLNKNKRTDSDSKITVEESNRVGEEMSSDSENSSSEQNLDFTDPFMEYGVVLKIDGNASEEAESFQSNSPNYESNILQNMRSDHRSDETDEAMELDFTDFCEKLDVSFSKLKRINRILRSDVKHSDTVNGGVENLIEINELRGTYSIEDAAKFLNQYEHLASSIFREFPANSNEDFNFQNIKNYCSMLKGKSFLKQEEKEFILASVPEKFQNVPETKQKIHNLLREKMEFTQELQNELSTLKLEDKEIKEIKEEIAKYKVIDDTRRIVDSARDYFSELTKILESGKISKNNYELFCEKLELPDDSKKLLFKIVIERVPGNKFEFFRNRIKLLKSILIDEQDVIRQLWERANTRAGKLQAKEKITRLYSNDLQIQASTETLLFHCMSISRNKKLKNIWKKTNNFFRGTNLRNVLAHGHPLLETLGASLDPDDLPSELVGKVLQLISDECVIDCMSRLLEISGTDLRGFLEIMDDEENSLFKDLREEISDCDRWKTYAILMPMKSGRNM